MTSQGANGAGRQRLGEATVAELSQIGHQRILRKGQSLFLGPDLGDSVLVVKAGRLKLCRLSAAGKEVILSLVEPGDLLVNPTDALSGSEPEIEALEEAYLVLLRWQDFQVFLRDRPAAALVVIRQLAERVHHLEERVEEMVFKDIRARLATALLRLATSYGSREPDGGVAVSLRVTQQELANLIGASREMVNHALADWKRQGWVELHGRAIVIRRAEALEALEAPR